MKSTKLTTLLNGSGAILRILVLLVAITGLIFIFIRLVPGDVVDVLALEGNLSTEQQAMLREEMGISQSWTTQYYHWIKAMIEGDFGESLRFHRPVFEIIAHALPVTFGLMGMSFLLGTFLALILATAAASTAKPWLIGLLNGITLWSVSVPTFCAGVGSILIFSIWLGKMPILGNIWMAAIILALDFCGTIVKPLYEDIRENTVSQYVRTAKAKGLSEYAITLRHILPNSMPVMLSLSGLSLASMLTGSITVEVLFGLHGIGRLALDAVNGRDYPVVQGVAVLITLCVLGINLLTDLAQKGLDPRLRSAGGKS